MTSSLPSHKVLQQAAEWFALLQLDADDKQRSDWQEWLAAHDDHRRAWQYVETVSQRFEPLKSSSAQQPATITLQKLQQKNLGRRQLMNGALSVFGVGVLGWFGLHATPLPELAMALAADYRTGTGEIRNFTLSDSTRVWLNTASALNVDYQTDLRRLQLVRGEVLIDTAKDPRLLVVDTAQGRLRPLGTRFTLRLDNKQTLLSVYEGAVEITTANFTHIINAGQQTRFSSEAMENITPANAAHNAWSQGILLADDISLADLIAELGRYHHEHIGITPAAGELRVLGGYPINDLDKTLAMLESALPIQVKRSMNWWITVDAAEKSQQ